MLAAEDILKEIAGAPVQKRAMTNHKVLNEAYHYPQPVSFSRGLRIDLNGLVILLISGCSAGHSIAPSAPPTEQETNSAPNSGGVPIVVPTFGIPEPANINPGRIVGTVYIGDLNRYFHTESCPNLGSSPTALSRQAATIQGYSACPVCNP